MQLVRRNSTSKWLPNPYWSSKGTTSAAERLQKRSRLVSGAFSLAENLSAFLDGQIQRASTALRSRAALPSLFGADSGQKRGQEQIFPRLGVQEGRNLADGDGGSSDKAVAPARSDLSLGDFVRAREAEVENVLAELEVSQKRVPREDSKPQADAKTVTEVAGRVPVLSQVGSFVVRVFLSRQPAFFITQNLFPSGWLLWSSSLRLVHTLATTYGRLLKPLAVSYDENTRNFHLFPTKVEA